jgi:predicted dehydrogenase
VPTAHSALIEFESGASAVALFSFESHLARTGVVEVTGVTGTLGFPDPNHFVGPSKLWRNGEEPTEIEPLGSTFGRGSGVLDLARAIRTGSAEHASGKLAFHVIDLMTSIAEAAAGGSAVELQSTAPKPEPLAEGWDPSAPTL